MNSLHIGVSTYNDLLQLVAPFTERKDPVMRNSIPTSQKLSATGQAFTHRPDDGGSKDL
jgi:hypothetical protein